MVFWEAGNLASISPSIVNRTQSNWISIKLNRTLSNPIHGLSSIKFSNRMKSNSQTKIGQSNPIELNSLDCVRLPNSIELNPWIECHWVPLSLITESSIEYAGISRHHEDNINTVYPNSKYPKIQTNTFQILRIETRQHVYISKNEQSLNWIYNCRGEREFGPYQLFSFRTRIMKGPPLQKSQIKLTKELSTPYKFHKQPNKPRKEKCYVQVKT